MTLTAEQITYLLADNGLLKTGADFKGEVEHLAYNSQSVRPKTLLFIKGNFKAAYLEEALQKGACAIVAPMDFHHETTVPTFRVDDVAAAMSILSMAFYDYPQNQLALIGITGTKGKTSTAYMAYEMMNEATQGKAALSSTVQVITGPNPANHYRAHLTTPESLDLFRWMHEAVNNGMTHMVMEVSSQAYKKERVYGLHFNVGVFLNISPDHIGPNEHPDFADYLACKMMLFDHAEQIVLNADSDHFAPLIERAREDVPADGIWLYARKTDDLERSAEVTYETIKEDLQGSTFRLDEHGQQAEQLGLTGEYTLDMPGDFNQGNAVAAMIATRLVGTDAKAMQKALTTVKVPGRMQEITTKRHGTIYVDYAHNYASIAALLHFVKANEHVQKLTIVVGAPGNKGVSRRPGIGKAVNEQSDVVYLTSDDPQFEDPNAIADEIQAAITNPKVVVHRQMNRTQAITEAIKHSGPADVVVLAGKGMDEYQKTKGVDVPYENDWAIAKRVVHSLEGDK